MRYRANVPTGWKAFPATGSRGYDEYQSPSEPASIRVFAFEASATTLDDMISDDLTGIHAHPGAVIDVQSAWTLKDGSPAYRIEYSIDAGAAKQYGVDVMAVREAGCILMSLVSEVPIRPTLRAIFDVFIDSLETSGESALPFTLDLPDGWVGGRLPDGYRQALLDYGGVHPDCADRVMELVDASEGVDGLYMAVVACGPYADLVVTVDDIPSELSADEVLEIGVAAWTEELSSPGEPDLVGEPTVTTTDSPFEGGRVMHWTWGQVGDASSFTRYLFASGERLWDLTFTSDWAPESNDTNDATFVAIATSFRLTQPAPPSLPGP